MKKFISAIFILSLLAACTPQPPLEEHKMRADDKVYDQIQKDYFLKGKIALSDIGNEKNNPWLSNAKSAAQNSLSKAGLLIVDTNKAQYILSGSIKDLGVPSCMFGTCESGSSIEYTMTDTKTKRTVYHDLLVVPYTQEYPLFGANMYLVMQQTMGGAIGNNFAHLIHILTLKKKDDLQ